MKTILAVGSVLIAGSIVVSWALLVYSVLAQDCADEREIERDNDYFLGLENGVHKRGVGGS